MTLSTKKDVPAFDKLLYPTIAALTELGGSGSIDEISEKVVELGKFPADILDVLHSDERQSLLEYRLAWARTYLKKVSAIENNSRGIWTITEAGKNLTPSECEQIPALVRKDYIEGRKADREKSDEAGIDDIQEDTELDWKQALLNVLTSIEPSAFERLSQRILRESGFTKVEVMGKSGDGGIDGMGLLRMNLVSFTVLFQCKRYKDSVGSSVVRDFRGAMQGRCDKGLIITTGTFTSEAKKEATRDGAPTIDLIDGDALCDLLKSLQLGISVEKIEKITIQPDWFKAI
jgi:restriction system protein